MRTRKHKLYDKLYGQLHGNYMFYINTRSATQGDACYRRDARIIINYK